MEINLPPDLDAFVKQLVERGYFDSPGDVFLTALYLLKDQEDLDEIKRERLRNSLAEAAGQLERGEGIDAEVVFSRLHEKIQRDLLKQLIQEGIEDREAGRMAPLIVQDIAARVDSRQT